MVQELITEIAFSLISVIGTAVGSAVLYYITKTIKNEQIKNIFTDATKIIGEGVDYVYQTYVENLKGTTLWNQDAMTSAKQQALDYIYNNLSKKSLKFLQENKQELKTWFEEQIEIYIKKSKDKNKTA